MGKHEQLRFYAASEFFNDDERLISHAIKDFTSAESPVEQIYFDLLNCRFKRWIDNIEQVLENVEYRHLKEWCENKTAELEILGGDIWSRGDFTMLQEKAWKLKYSGGEE